MLDNHILTLDHILAKNDKCRYMHNEDSLKSQFPELTFNYKIDFALLL